MARQFDDASQQYLISAVQAVLISPPISMACWFKSDDITVYQTLVGIIDYSSDEYYLLAAAGTIANDPVRATTYNGVVSASAVSSTGYSAGTWHHACGVFAATNSRAAYIDGGSKGTNATSVTGVGPVDRFEIGGRVMGGGASKALFMSGAIAEAAIWNGALSDAEAAILAAGFSPLFVKPENLVAYWSLIRDEDQDRVGGWNLTDNGGPTISTHVPKVLYPAPQFVTSLAAYVPTPTAPPPLAPPAVDSAMMIA